MLRGAGRLNALTANKIEEWQSAGLRLGQDGARIATQLALWIWQVGDWINEGRDLGMSLSDATKILRTSWNGSAQTISQYAYVARKFPPHRRKWQVGSSFYVLVAGKPVEDQDYFLDIAEKHELTWRAWKALVQGRDNEVCSSLIRPQPCTTVRLSPDVYQTLIRMAETYSVRVKRRVSPEEYISRVIKAVARRQATNGHEAEPVRLEPGGIVR